MAERKRFYRKNVELFLLIEKIKLWPSRKGILHGIKHIEKKGNYLAIVTHCGEEFQVFDSRSSRSARWVRNKWISKPCPRCKVPEWKLEKYSKTFFESHYGSTLRKPDK